MPRELPPLSAARPLQGRLVFGILIVAAVMRVLAVVFISGDTFRFVDEASYFDGAIALQRGAELPSHPAAVPAYPAFLSLLMVLLPAQALTVRLGQAIVAAFGVLVCYGLGCRIGGNSAGILAAGIYSLDPLLVVSAGLLYPEALAALMLTLAVIVVWEAGRRKSAVLATLAGTLWAIVTLLRPVALSCAPAIIAWLLMTGARQWRWKATLAALLAAAWLLVLVPWGIRNHRMYGTPLPVGAAGIRTVPVIGVEAEQRGLGPAVLHAVQQDPWAYVRRTLREFGHFWELYPTRLVSDRSTQRAALSELDPRVSREPLAPRSPRDLASALSFGAELVLAAVGLAVGWRKQRSLTVWLLSIVLCFALGYSLFFGKLRYRIPILPIVMVFAGVGTAAVLSWFGRGQTIGADRRGATPSQQ